MDLQILKVLKLLFLLAPVFVSSPSYAQEDSSVYKLEETQDRVERDTKPEYEIDVFGEVRAIDSAQNKTLNKTGVEELAVKGVYRSHRKFELVGDVSVMGAAQNKYEFSVSQLSALLKPFSFSSVEAGYLPLSIGYLNQMSRLYSSQPDFYERLFPAETISDLEVNVGLALPFYQNVSLRAGLRSGESVGRAEEPQQIDSSKASRSRPWYVAARLDYDWLLSEFYHWRHDYEGFEPLTAWGGFAELKTLEKWGLPVDAGLVAEALVFYEVQKMGPDSWTQAYIVGPYIKWKYVGAGYRLSGSQSRVGSRSSGIDLDPEKSELIHFDFFWDPYLHFRVEKVRAQVEGQTQLTLRDEWVSRLMFSARF